MTRLVSAMFSIFVISQNLARGSSIDGRIVGGEDAAAGEFPWQVSLRSRSTGSHFCGGSLVSLQHVLTAGHCVSGTDASSIIVVSGTNSLATGGEEHAVITVFVHSQYSSPAAAYHVNDVAVLVLDAPIIETSLQRPITLAIEDVPVGAEVVVSGWGRILTGSNTLPTALQKLNLTIIDSTDCQRLWGETVILEDHLCGVQQNGSGVCNGDSGGALVRDNQVVGIVSWANPCGLGYPDVYTRVFYHLYWIGNLVFNTDIETTETLIESTTTSSGQVSLKGNYVLTIFLVYNVSKKLFFPE